MDKKNTMLLTVIAVATLLVAVVGATFAYFAVTNPSDAVTNVGVTAGKIGAVSLTNNTDTLKLHVTTEDMKKSEEADVKFYAVKEESSTATTGGIYATVDSPITIATINLNGADEKDTVKCQISVKVDLSGTMAGNLQKGDLLMTLKGTGYTGLDGVASFDFAQQEDTPKVTYQGTEPDQKTGTVTFTGTGTIDLTNNSEKTIAATIWLVNSHDRDQKALAGKTLTMDFTTQVTGCETTSPKAAA